MKNYRIFILLIFVSIISFTCNHKNKFSESSDGFIKAIYYNDNLYYDFNYKDTNLVYVVYHNLHGFIDTFYMDNKKPIKQEKIFGNELFEYDDEGKCKKITYYRSLPDSIFSTLELFYERENLSRIDFYGGDGEYSGNISYEYDTYSNPLYILNSYITPNIYNYWMFQPNHCINQNSDVEREEGYALFTFRYSFPMYPPQDNYALVLYDYDYTYYENGLPKEALIHSHNETNNLDNLRFEYIEMETENYR